MLKSAFAKYITAFAIIILISFFILSSIVSNSIYDYASDARENDVTLIAQISSALIESAYRTSPEASLPSFAEIENEKLQRILTAISPYAQDISFLVTDADGRILAVYNRTAGIRQDATAFPAFCMTALQNDGIYLETGTLDGVTDSIHMVAGCPIHDEADEALIGAVFACSSNVNEDALSNVLNKSILLSNLWITLAMMVAVYFITERLLSPLKDMSQAAREFSRGNFDTRIHVVGNDEVAEFAVTFNQMAESLSQSENLRSTFLANVSHDLRTPMTTIAGFVDGILDGAIPPERQEHYLRIVSDEIHRLSRLVSQLLDISRMEAGVRKFIPTDFDICEVARLILISFEAKIEEKKLQVEFDCESDRMPVYADRDAIHQIIYNICDNAIKFSREGGVLHVSIHPGERGKYHVCIYNEGAGVPAEDLPYIFDRFYKSDKSRGLDKVGVGLGLYITRTILNANGERIWADSAEGQWCSFTFTIQRAG